MSEPTTTEVCGYMVRPRNFSMFADLTGPGVAVRFDKVANSADTCLVFDAVLAPETVAAILERMTSRDDVDQGRRAELAAVLADLQACLDAAPTTESPLTTCAASVLLELGRYTLGAPT